MWIVRLALRRPYTFVVAALVLLLLTPFVLIRTPTDIFPDINIPVVSVVWVYNGLSAREVEERIIYNHERMISTLVNDIEHTESTAYNGAGVIKVFLQPGASVSDAVGQIAASGQTALRFLPPGVTPPFVIRYNASSVPILQYSLASHKFSEQELQDMAMNRIKIGLSTVRGASVPYPYGGKARVVAVDLDLPALQAKNLAPQDVVNAFNAQNFVLPSGTAKIGETEYNVSLDSNPAVLAALNDLPVKTVNGAVIRVGDVAQVHDGYQPQQNVVRLDGMRGVLLTILKTGAASTLRVVERVKNAMPLILSGLPSELEVKEFADQSLFVRAAVNSVVKEGLIAAALTAVMILLFLGSWRSTFIIALSIPLSVLSSLALLSALGETINLMTLGGLALAVGILVDDATVEIENVHRQMALGKPNIQAILDGAQEIALPAFVSTLCICIVFVPMFFLTGVARYLFVPLAEAVVFAMLASYALSRTLIPTLVMWFYRNVEYRGHAADPGAVSLWLRPFVALQIRFEQGFDRFREGYRTLLGMVLAHRIIFVIFFPAFCVGSWLLIPQLGQDFFPSVDAGHFRLHVRAHGGLRIEETTRLVDRVEAVIREAIPAKELGGILDNIGIPFGGVPLTYIDNGLTGTGDADILVSLLHDHQPTEGYVRRLRTRLNRDFPEATFYFLPADIVNQTINFGLPAPFDIQIMGREREKNRTIAGGIAEKIRKIPGAVDVRIQQPFDQPELHFAVDRIKASQIGLSERDVANSVLLSLSGSSQVQPNYWLNPQNGIQYPVSIRVPEYPMNSLSALHAIPVSANQPGKSDAQILANLASVQRRSGSPIYSHYNVMPVIDVFGGVSGRDLGGVLRDIAPIIEAAKKELPKGSSIMLRGQADTMNKSFTGLGTGLGLAIALIYLLLVVNFQSWLDPFIIITALPGALAGVVWGLYLTLTTLSVPALMGAIMSLGVATANSVLVVTFARNNLQQGHDPLTSAWEAGVGRLRPVLMTALAMILGMLPMSLALGEGGEQNAPLGRAVIGGLILATVATLFFVPVVFSLLHKNR
ncbi:efflux RND transporter permease subunit [Desulforhabdus amnigena]|jgi:multidrug efflux pump subunit AcrB|uniref:RND transporter n=1 Tax=Desulforhabdus amnigena TaxID=40218 RepID=A0A9W6L8X6_9BACT|nr:efflux RND transporter permease subunit [Desulforhabdus amnigena]NLJ27604.1 efflux RND transporter permease subunit [Deltaproteobacteria bacterium]GLI35129.1 RND transporter [Desulforhabdus amnigena]